MAVLYRKLNAGEEQALWNLMNRLDHETCFMMFEPGERVEKAGSAAPLAGVIEQAARDEIFLLAAESGRELVGYIMARRENLNRVLHRAYVVLGVLEQHRGLGIGTEFMKRLDEWAAAQRITRLELTVMCPNLIAKRLYEKAGFVVEGTKKNSMRVNGAYVDEYYMAKILP